MLEFRVLGSLDLRGSEGEEILSVLSQPKRMALLSYLAVATPRGFHRRDRLVGLFWPELNQDRARAALRKSLHHLRRSLGEEAVLSRGDEEVSLQWDLFHCDVASFEEALEGRPEEAMELYRGHLLEGFHLAGCQEFQRWMEGERKRLREAAAGAAWVLAHRFIAAGLLADGERMGQRALDLAPTDEAEIRRLVEELARAGDRAAAVGFYEKFAERLEEELELRPDAESRDLVERIRDSMVGAVPGKERVSAPAREPEPAAPPVAAAEPTPNAGPRAADARAELKRFRSAVADRYRIEREIGRGGMATVYLARDPKHDRQVAVKVLDPDLAQTLGADRFLREIKTAANLTHPHILPLFDSGEADGFLFYVMPYVKGESLRARLTKERQLPVEDAIQITREIADALAYAHEEGVVHRDVKPANIMLEAGHAVLADFGVAHAVAEAKEDRITRTGTSLGTPAYMSPEQAAGERDPDGRSDQYALGCVLYEMLAGHPPFAGAQVEVVVRQHLTEEPPSVTQARPSVAQEVVKVINRALSKSPADRFRTTGEMATALSSTTSPVQRQSKRLPKLVWIGLAVALLVIAGGVLAMLRGGAEVSEPTESATPAGEPEHLRTAIAVLPFQNLSADGPYAYFAGGLHDELLTQLAKVAALKVISRTSVMGYAGTNLPPLRQIASELGVGSVVEGSVQVMGDRLRVNVQLIDATTDEHLWAESYDRTLDDAFAIQSDVAQRVVAAVGATLGGSEQQRLTEAPTANAEAYRLYLQGQEYERRPGALLQDQEIAQQLYEGALVLDSTFALAHAALSRVHGSMSWFRIDTSPERLARQREEAETALRLAPELPEAHIAMGDVHYFGRRDWQAALDEYAIALQALPNDAELWSLIGYAHRRLGNWDEFDAAYEKATQLDPRDADLFYNLGGFTYRVTRRYPDAIAAFNRALTLAPDLHDAAVNKGLVYLDWKGELDTLRAVLDQLPPDAAVGEGGTARAQRVQLLLLERKPDSLLAVLGSARDAVFEGQLAFLPTSLYAAWAHELRGDDVAAQAAFDSARVLLDSVLVALPDDWRVHVARGLALAGLGRRQGALREARWLEQSVVYREDAYDGPSVAENRARILAQAGEVDAALDEIEQILTGPGWLSVHRLRLDPRWDPIRDHPRFQALLERYAEDVER